jgi:hypothetical protein
MIRCKRMDTLGMVIIVHSRCDLRNKAFWHISYFLAMAYMLKYEIMCI